MKKMKHLRDYAKTVKNSEYKQKKKKKKKIQNKSLHPKIFCKKKKRMIKEIREDYKKP